MAITNLIFDPQISSDLSRRLITAQILQRKAARLAVINPEYVSQISALDSKDTLDAKFINSHEMLLIKSNIENDVRLASLLTTYKIMSLTMGDPKFKDAFDSSILSTILHLFDTVCDTDEDLLNEVTFWATSRPDEIIKHIDKFNIKDKVNNKNELAHYNRLLGSLAAPNYQDMFTNMLQMLFTIHVKHLEKKNIETFSFLDNKKLVWFIADQLRNDSYERALTIFAMLSHKDYVYLDSATPYDVIAKAAEPAFNVFAVVLNNASSIELKRPFSNMAVNSFISMQDPDIDILLEKMAQNHSELLKSKVTKRSFKDYIEDVSYKNLIGNYMAYSHKNDKIYLVVTNKDPKKRFRQDVFDLKKVLDKENKPSHSSGDEKNLSDINKNQEQIKSTLDKLLNLISKNTKEQPISEDLAKKLEDLEDSIRNMKVNNSSNSNFMAHYRARDIFGNPEDETKADIESALQEEFDKQDPSTKDNDPLQRQFMNQSKSSDEDVTSEMPNTTDNFNDFDE